MQQVGAGIPHFSSQIDGDGNQKLSKEEWVAKFGSADGFDE